MLNNKSSVQKIGIFDSGIGGLTVARAIRSILPNENLLYVGDTAHSPWGDKSQSQITSYSLALTNFLLENDCNIIVIACNTASCIALESIVTKYPNIKLFNVIDPIISLLAQMDFSHLNDIGIIGTKQTIKSNAYGSRLKQLKPTSNSKLQIKSLATPLLVPLIEEGWTEHNATKLIIAEYLSALDLKDQSILILGCTHYPLIKTHIEDYYITLNKNIMIIDSTLLIAKEIKNFLLKNNQLQNNKVITSSDFYCTGNSDFFFKIAKQFFANITLKFLPLWE
jgi:glutamate racemase